MIHKRTHPVYIPGCKPCKWATLAIFDVEGGHNAQSTKQQRELERDLHKYRDKRQAGEWLRSIRSGGVKGMDQSAKLQDEWSSNEKTIVDNNSPETVKVIKKTLLNE